MPYRVVVVGAGFGGIGMAIALKQAGIAEIFLPGTSTQEIVEFIHKRVAARG